MEWDDRIPFRYLQGYMGTIDDPSIVETDYYLDTFKDIWGPFIALNLAKGVPVFRYLQGYMGTHAVCCCFFVVPSHLDTFKDIWGPF